MDKRRWLSPLLIATMALFATAGTARAAEDCDCEIYRPLMNLQALSEDVAGAGISVLRKYETGPFYVSPDTLSPYRLKSNADALIPEKCKRELILSSLPKVTLVGTGTIGGPGNTPFLANSSDADRIFNQYNALYAMYAANTCPAGDGYAACMKANGPSLYSQFSSKFRSRSDGDINSDLQGKGWAPTPGDAAVMRAYNAIMSSKDENAAIGWLKANKGKLNEDQAVQLVQAWGKRMLSDYDNDRNNLGGKAKGVVTFGQIISAGRNNTALGIDTGANMNDKEFEGICRDIASAQGQMLQALGFKHVYVYSQTLADGGYHVTLISQSPNSKTPNKVYTFNYGDRLNPAAGDPRVFQADNRDISTNVRVYKPGGGPAADIATEFGKFMAARAGFSVATLDPLARVNGQFVGGDVHFKTGTDLTMGYGVDGQGARYILGGFSQTWNPLGLTPGKFGVVAGEVTRPGDLFGNPGGNPLKLDVIYAQLEQTFKTPQLKLTPDLQARIEATASAIFMASHTRDKDNFTKGDGKWAFQGDFRLTTDVRVDQQWKDKVWATYKAGVQVVPGIKDIRNNEVPQVPVVALNYLFFTAEGRMKLAETSEGRAYLMAATTVLWNELGTRARVDAGVVTPKYGFIMSLEGRLGDSAPYEDGSGRRLSANFFWQPKHFIRVSAGGWVPLETDLPATPGGMGNLIVTWP